MPALVTVLLGALNAHALSILPSPWEQTIQRAAFVGVVVSDEDSVSVAKCTVIDSWKGPTNGSKLAISIQMWDGMGERFPVKKGERYLMGAFKNHQAAKPVTQIEKDPLRLALRERATADYMTPIYQGVCKLPDDVRGLTRTFGFPQEDLDLFMKASAEFLALGPEEQELRILKIAGG
jgi:hypothetical protein